MSGDGFVVVVTLQPKPLSSLHLDRRFTRIDYTSRCTMLNVLEGMARILKVDRADLVLETEGGANVILEQALAEHHDQQSQKKYPCSSLGGRKTQRWPRHMKRQRREINLIVRHVPVPHKLVTCTVEGGDDGHELRRTTVQLPNTTTFGELLVHARNQRHGGLEFEGPIYGKVGELDTTLRDAWARDGCKVDGALHVGLSVVISFPGLSQKSLPLVMGPSDTVGDVKQRVCCHQGVARSQQSVTVRGETQKLEDTVALKELCAARVEVGRSARAAPVELHLELIVKEIAFPSQSLTKAVLGNGFDPSTSAPFAHSFFDTGKESRTQETCLFLPPPPPGVAPKSNTHAHGGVDSFVATRSSVGRTAKHPTQGYGFRGIALFAVSPSGRALALRVSGPGTVLSAKEQVAVCEGVPPCQQRLLWRGVPLEPDHASLYKFGIRGGDTLVVGYRFSRATLDVPTPVDDAEGGSHDVVAMGGSEGARNARESECAINLKDDGLVRQEEHVPERFNADGDGRKAVKENNGTGLIHSADARAANGGLDIAGGSGSDGSDGSDGSGGGSHGGSGGSGSSGGSSSAAVQGREKGSGRRTWWSKKARNSRNLDRQERDGVSGGGVGGAAAAAAAAAASSAGATHTHSAPPPAPLQPARDASGGTGGVDGVSRDTESASAAPDYLLASTRQQPTPMALRGNFSAWVRRKHSRRTSAPSASSADGGSGE